MKTNLYAICSPSHEQCGLRADHLNKLRQQGLFAYLYPEVINHPEQAYVRTQAGRQWLINQGIKVEENEDTSNPQQGQTDPI